jgi:large subunit ribosomal protein L7/L12
MEPRPPSPYHPPMADLKHLSDQLLQLSVREAIQLAAHLLAGAGVSLSGGDVSTDSNDVVLMSFGANKISAIKVVRELTSIGLKEAKDLVEAAPQVVLRGVTRAIADNARTKLIEIGATVDIRPS